MARDAPASVGFSANQLSVISPCKVCESGKLGEAMTGGSCTVDTAQRFGLELCHASAIAMITDADVRRALRSALLSRGVVVATATKPERRDAPSDKPAEGLRASFMYPGWIGSAVRTSNTVFLDDNSHDSVLWGDDQAQVRIDAMVDAYFSGKEVP